MRTYNAKITLFLLLSMFLIVVTCSCGSCIRNAKEENTRDNKQVRNSLETILDKRCGIVYGM